MTKIFLSKTINLVILIVVVSLAAQAVFSFNLNAVKAQSLWDRAQEGGLNEVGSIAYDTSAEPTDIRIIVARIIQALLGLLGVVFIYLIFWAGYKWMTAEGDSSKVDEAKQRLQTAIIGLLIILAAYSITAFVVECAVKASLGISGVWYCPSLSL